MSDQKNEESFEAGSNPEEGIPLEVISSETLLKGKSELLIQHGDSTYRLRITQNGKLILCK